MTNLFHLYAQSYQDKRKTEDEEMQVTEQRQQERIARIADSIIQANKFRCMLEDMYRAKDHGRMDMVAELMERYRIDVVPTSMSRPSLKPASELIPPNCEDCGSTSGVRYRPAIDRNLCPTCNRQY